MRKNNSLECEMFEVRKGFEELSMDMKIVFLVGEDIHLTFDRSDLDAIADFYIAMLKDWNKLNPKNKLPLPK